MKKKLIGFAAGMLLCGHVMAETINVDFTNSGAQVQSADTIRLRNVNIPGYGNFQVDMKWDSERMVLVPVRANLDTLSQFAATSRRYQSATNSVPDLDQACVQEFGAQYQQADWQDIKSAVGNDANTLQSFKNTVAMAYRVPYFVKHGGQVMNNQGYVYKLQTGESSNGRLDLIQADLGLHYSGYENAQVICVRSGNTSPFTPTP
jgi:hypothetical protein